MPIGILGCVLPALRLEMGFPDVIVESGEPETRIRLECEAPSPRKAINEAESRLEEAFRELGYPVTVLGGSAQRTDDSTGRTRICFVNATP